MAHKAVLTWVAPASGDAPVSYDVQRAPVNAGVVGTFASIATPEPTATTFEDDTVLAGQSYEYQVASVNGSGESAFVKSQVVLVPLAVPQPPTNLQVAVS